MVNSPLSPRGIPSDLPPPPPPTAPAATVTAAAAAAAAPVALNRIKPEAIAMIVSSPIKPLPSPTRVMLAPIPPSTVVGNWILTEHSFAPKREHFMAVCSAMARRRVVDHLMEFRFRQHGLQPVLVHHSRLAMAGGMLAALLHQNKKKEDVDVEMAERKSDTQLDKGEGEGKSKGKGEGEGKGSGAEERTEAAGEKGDVPVADEKAATTKVVEKDVKKDVEEDTEHAVDKNAQSAKKLAHVQTVAMDEDLNTFVRTPESLPRKSPVLLSEDDTPRTFDVIVKFLYCEEIRFNYLTFDEIVRLAMAAHRWSLLDLYNATFAYVMDQNLLEGGLGIRTFIPLVSHAETPESFRRYFCIAVGHHFDVLYPRLKAATLVEHNAPVRPVVPPLWDVVISQRMLSHIVHCITLYSTASYDEYLLDVVLRYYSTRSGPTDDDVLGLLSQLNWDEIDLTAIFDAQGLSKNWNARGIRLAAAASCSPQTASLEVRIPWNIPLQKLLRSDTWSFQTEHVMCGPYVCYLHVRKGGGPEVSLFVHIWYPDGKLIGQDARHESVRVKCRATERNCRCDSGRQWSSSTHGFLENLKFEGKLDGYPGLGWSQFLEEKRLKEWRGNHGEDCGLAITTVLQFTRPTKQFEGPARRSLRAPSPGRIASPIQKKPRIPATRMKLREAR